MMKYVSVYGSDRIPRDHSRHRQEPVVVPSQKAKPKESICAIDTLVPIGDSATPELSIEGKNNLRGFRPDYFLDRLRLLL